MSDLIGNLVSTLGVSPAQAEGTAGTVLGLIQQHAPAGALDSVVQKEPAAQGWIDRAAPALTNQGGGGLGGLGGLAGSLLGGGGLGGLGSLGGLVQGAAAIQVVTSQLEKLGIPSSVTAQAIPLVLSFVQSKLGTQSFSALTSKVPFLQELAQHQQSSSGGGLAGALGKLF